MPDATDPVRSHEIGVIWADDEDLRNIFAQVKNLRDEAAKKNTAPIVLPLIDGFIDWYNSLGWYDVHIMINDTMVNAISRRDTILAIMGKAPVKAALPLEEQPVKPPMIPTQYKIAGVVTAVGVTVLAVLKKLHVI